MVYLIRQIQQIHYTLHIPRKRGQGLFIFFSRRAMRHSIDEGVLVRAFCPPKLVALTNDQTARLTKQAIQYINKEINKEMKKNSLTTTAGLPDFLIRKNLQ